MRFFYHELSGAQTLTIERDELAHLKALRLREGESARFRNLADDILYTYKLISFGKREAVLTLCNATKNAVMPAKSVDLAWCAIDPKVVEKSLPFINELGVARLFILWCEKSQRQFRFDLARMRKIAIFSCEQCGRTTPLEIVLTDPESFVLAHPNAALIDFGGEAIAPERVADKTLIVGPEGGFGRCDYAAFERLPRFGIDTPLTLRSESALIFAASLALVR
ncbi:ribosomal RNA small subunit methyltransferase E [Campylobacterota bacterium]|nr:ribosomal RNA small subunit methyltransferase E [Campylobacterota bacterium]